MGSEARCLGEGGWARVVPTIPLHKCMQSMWPARTLPGSPAQNRYRVNSSLLRGMRNDTFKP